LDGVPGELCICGLGLTTGYLNSPELTAEKFVPAPFGREPGAVLYKTGDLVRCLTDGNIAFLRRIDHQVKIRGFRIELQEIEATIRQHPSVRQALVIVQSASTDDKRLVSYVVLKSEMKATGGELYGFLKNRLPGYMAPSAIVFLDSIPLTSN